MSLLASFMQGVDSQLDQLLASLALEQSPSLVEEVRNTMVAVYASPDGKARIQELVSGSKEFRVYQRLLSAGNPLHSCCTLYTLHACSI